MQLKLNLVANTERTNDIEEEVWNVNSNGNWNNWNYTNYNWNDNYVIPFLRSWIYLFFVHDNLSRII